MPPLPEQLALDPLMRPLKHGEVGVSFFTTSADTPQREILPESKLELLDRMYQPGDLLKRSIDDVRSGIVTRYAVNRCGLTSCNLTIVFLALMSKHDLSTLSATSL